MTKLAGPFGRCRHPSACTCTSAFDRGPCPNWIEEAHTVRGPNGTTPAWQVVYWARRDGNSVASGPTGADRCVVQVFTPGHGYTDVAEFALPFAQDRLDRMLRGFEAVHAAGKQARSLELSTLISDNGLVRA